MPNCAGSTVRVPKGPCGILSTATPVGVIKTGPEDNMWAKTGLTKRSLISSHCCLSCSNCGSPCISFRPFRSWCRAKNTRLVSTFTSRTPSEMLRSNACAIVRVIIPRRTASWIVSWIRWNKEPPVARGEGSAVGTCPSPSRVRRYILLFLLRCRNPATISPHGWEAWGARMTHCWSCYRPHSPLAASTSRQVRSSQWSSAFYSSHPSPSSRKRVT